MKEAVGGCVQGGKGEPNMRFLISVLILCACGQTASAEIELDAGTSPIPQTLAVGQRPVFLNAGPAAVHFDHDLFVTDLYVSDPDGGPITLHVDHLGQFPQDWAPYFTAPSWAAERTGYIHLSTPIFIAKNHRFLVGGGSVTGVGATWSPFDSP